MITQRNPFTKVNFLPGGTKSRIKYKPNMIFISMFEYKVLQSSLTFYKSFRKSHDSKIKSNRQKCYIELYCENSSGIASRFRHQLVDILEGFDGVDHVVVG